MTVSRPVVAVAAELAARLSVTEIDQLADHVQHGTDGLRRLAAASSSSAVRHACVELTTFVPDASPEFISGVLVGASAAAAAGRAAMSVDVVWTGPSSVVTSSRLTSAVVVQLIDEASSHLLLASFATQDERSVVDALVRAAARDVDVVLLLERPQDNATFHQHAQPLGAVAARRLTWSGMQRPAGASMHAKVLVVDGAAALVGSANITAYAFDRNLECGLLVRGGPVPRRIWDHVQSLVDGGVLVRSRGS